MIFVTVGTHEQPFDRLVEYIDKIKKDNVILEEVIIQTGFCKYKPRMCKWDKMFSYKEMTRYVSEARIVITHGGPSSFIMPLQVGKIPIVVPRQKAFGEHVNDHQVEFAKIVAERLENIIVVEDIDILVKIIQKYDIVIRNMKKNIISNNAEFCNSFGTIVDGIISKNSD